jgi:hypothetical protein
VRRIISSQVDRGAEAPAELRSREPVIQMLGEFAGAVVLLKAVKCG